jgi:hypothetical protein
MKANKQEFEPSEEVTNMALDPSNYVSEIEPLRDSD